MMGGSILLLLACGGIFFGIAVLVLMIWLYLACLVDVFRKTDTEFKDRTLWLVLLIAGLVFGYGGIAALIYYLLYRPRLDFWN